MNVRTCLVASAAMLWFTAGTAEAQLSGTLDVNLNLTSACTIAGDNNPSTADFGELNFGEAPATFVGQLTASATGGAGGSGQVQLVCSPDVTSVNIAIDEGQNPGEGEEVGLGARALAGPSSGFVPYRVYQDSGHTVEYSTTAVPFTIPVAGEPFDLPIYGVIDKTGPDALPSGAYTDTLSVTVQFD